MNPEGKSSNPKEIEMAAMKRLHDSLSIPDYSMANHLANAITAQRYCIPGKIKKAEMPEVMLLDRALILEDVVDAMIMLSMLGQQHSYRYLYDLVSSRWVSMDRPPCSSII